MRQHHEAEVRRQPFGDRLPALGVVVAAVDAVVVLRVEAAVDGGVGRDLVHALAEFRVGVGHEVGRDSLVARLPGGAAVERAVDAAGAHRDVHLLARVVDDDRVRRGAAVAGAPFAAVRVVPEAAVELEVFAAVGGFPDRDRLAAGPDDARAGTRRRGGSARRVPGRRRCRRGTGWRPPRARSTFRPRSSEWKTVGPQCSERTPTRIRVRPSRVSMPMLGTSLIRKCGPETDQSLRSGLVASQRPFLVPIARTKLSAVAMPLMQPSHDDARNGFRRPV